MAREYKFIQRQGSIEALAFVKLLIFNDLDQSQLSLLDLKLDLQTYFDCKVSREAIHKRFTPETVSFMKALLAKLIKFRLASENYIPSAIKAFNRLCIKDSTKFAIPKEFVDAYPGFSGIFNKGNALMNIQYEFDLLSGNWTCLDFTKATRNDQADSRETLDNIEKGDLLIRDLGYVTMPYLVGIVNKEAYFLNRLPTTINVYRQKKEQYLLIDWKAIDKTFKSKKLSQMELNVILSNNCKLESRMVIVPVPDDVSQERIKEASKHAKSKGCQLSNDYKIKSHYNIFITNVPKEIFSLNDIVQVYRLRWQIEIVFKTWKSSLSVHKAKKVKKERFECQLIARIIWALINWRLYQSANLALKEDCPEEGISVLKFFKRAIKYSSFLRVIIEDTNRMRKWVKEIIIPLLPYLIIETKKGKTSHCKILSNYFNF